MQRRESGYGDGDGWRLGLERVSRLRQRQRSRLTQWNGVQPQEVEAARDPGKFPRAIARQLASAEKHPGLTRIDASSARWRWLGDARRQMGKYLPLALHVAG